ncbi:glycosyltransferase family 4 protein [Microbulbifer yueqingensis]|uniref:Glycosyltransferase involved in cell wall bisynthesis n=1 Tax=Microbulbifer yueqingensis TaxID=658219 RepID=A0A1G8YAM7_9GAMM|nr:glycosyltransferase family 4 protein [Microbulbifer yueqingensis]SDJ99949.1 Glycosyltransferase involved in cell wall bisynthesis [Microbulbifer yueqingensis]
MKVMQLLPALNSGGVERGTLDLARALVAAGHESAVVSSGGRLVQQLELEGSRHLTLPIHRKSLASLREIRPLRELIRAEKPDILHVRSRVPAWLTYFAWKKLDPETRPRLVSTAHGLYSINRYSAIMASAEQVIAISDCVRDYLTGNYARYLKRPPEVIYRGVDTGEFHPGVQPPDGWRDSVEAEFPALRDRRWLLLPGRLTRWKGQEDFLELMAELDRDDLHGVVLGGAEPNKQHYEEELRQRAVELGLKDRVSFVGQRSDIRFWYKESSLVYNLSKRPEPFGRTVIEAVAIGTPIIGYNIGGPAESLRACFPEGLVPSGSIPGLKDKTLELLDSSARPVLQDDFTLATQASRTISLYDRLLAERRQGVS